MQGKQFMHVVGLAVAGLVAAAVAAHAQVTQADIGVNPTFMQTDPTTVVSTGGFFSARAFFTNTTDFDTGTLLYSGPISGANLVPGSSPPSLTFGDSNPSFSALQSDFPGGGYVLSLVGGAMGPMPIFIQYDDNAYSNTPQLAAASFSALQGLNALDSITLDFNAMEVSPNATPAANNIFFSVVDSSNSTVFNETLLTTDTSVTIPGGVLAAGQGYSFDLLFDDRITDSTEGYLKTQFYDTHTDGSFSTAAGAVPEASTWAMMLIGFGGLGLAVARRGRKQAATVAR